MAGVERESPKGHLTIEMVRDELLGRILKLKEENERLTKLIEQSKLRQKARALLLTQIEVDPKIEEVQKLLHKNGELEDLVTHLEKQIETLKTKTGFGLTRH